MKEILKKIAVAGIGSVLVAGVSFAAPTVGNEGTGRDSNNEVDWSKKQTITVDTDNNATIKNDVLADQQTGDNRATDNDGDTSIDTGDASATVSVTNKANDSSVDVAMPEISDANVMNSDTGRDSNNEIEFKEESHVSVDTDNVANVQNCINVMQNTGGNRASDNDGNVSITTGSASADVSVSNTLNMSEVSVSQ